MKTAFLSFDSKFTQKIRNKNGNDKEMMKQKKFCECQYFGFLLHTEYYHHTSLEIVQKEKTFLFSYFLLWFCNEVNTKTK